MASEEKLSEVHKELGREMARHAKAQRDNRTIHQRYGEAKDALETQYDTDIAINEQIVERSMQRIAELMMVIEKSETTGVDPVLVKLASEGPSREHVRSTIDILNHIRTSGSQARMAKGRYLEL